MYRSDTVSAEGKTPFTDAENQNRLELSIARLNWRNNQIDITHTKDLSTSWSFAIRSIGKTYTCDLTSKVT